MAESVGGVFYEVTLDTSKMVEGERAAQRSIDSLGTRLTAVSSATKIHAAGLGVAGVAAREAANSTNALAVANTKAADATEQHTSSSRRLFSALRGNKLAIADVVTSLSTGQGLGQALLTAKGAFTALAGAAAAALAAAVAGFVLGRKEAEEFNRSVTLTGNVSGTTADKLGAMAERMDSLGGITRGQAAEALNLFAEAGVRGGDSLTKFAEAAIRLEQAGGPAVAATVKAFDALGADPVAASLKLNESVNFLTVELYRQIKALQDQGKVTDAARLAQEAYADSLLERTPKITERLGLLQRAWRSLTTVAREGWDALLNVGRENTQEDRLQTMRDRLAKLQRDEANAGTKTIGGRATGSFGSAGRTARQAEIAQLLQQVGAYEQASRFAQQTADADANRVAQVRSAAEEDKKAKGARKDKFDDAKYLLDLQEQSADAILKISLVEKEAQAKNDKLLRDGEITYAVHEKAKTLIAQAAAQERLDIQLRNAEGIRAAIEEGGKQEEEARKKAAEQRAKGQEFAQGVLLQGNEIAQLQAELEAKSALLLQFAAQDQENAELYAAARVNLEQQTTAKIAEIVQRGRDQELAQQAALLQAYGGLFGSMADLTRNFAGKQDGVYKALFAASKAFAIAESIIKIQQGIAQAASLPFPANLGAMASVVAATSSIVSTIAGTQYGGGRQYGGPTSAGSLYRVNETGRPEMFTAANGAQYMLPTQSGRVTAADQVGGSARINVVIQNTGTPQQVQSQSFDQQTSTLRLVTADLVDQISNNSGPVWSALRSSTNVQGRIS